MMDHSETNSLDSGIMVASENNDNHEKGMNMSYLRICKP
jgi:hypothetical protein